MLGNLLLRRERRELDALQKAYYFRKQQNHILTDKLLVHSESLLKRPESLVASFSLGFLKGWLGTNNTTESRFSFTAIAMKLWQIKANRELAKDTARDELAEAGVPPSSSSE
ncbi:hypothetical protein OE749_10795 [Aestuariibacter sp. AA17]|uniref:Uncharacterized protein n=1 Tax=Fluctibacter corallii TaxID=2984329 RepID=A0ABT3A975_9ALTE|nr:hypothetical protein [Aestuariibacter sp. AA17]MCV2885178.1 hypothetical protein [Aestuariibacter sp. AA17]